MPSFFDLPMRTTLSFESARSMSASVPLVRGFLYLVLHPRLLLTLVAGILGAIAYTWIAAVRAVPDVRRRKRAMREAWLARRRG